MRLRGEILAEVLRGWAPLTVFEKADAPEGQRLRFRGIISTEHKDLQGEIILQDGLDLTHFKGPWGWFNDNHKSKTGRELGKPMRVWQTTITDPKTGKKVKATAVEGVLLDDDEGRQIFNKAQAMAKLGNGAGYGFSIEGSILKRNERTPKIVEKAMVREVAITRCPVNPYTSLEAITKSLHAAGLGGFGLASLQKAATVGYVPPEQMWGEDTASLQPVIPTQIDTVAYPLQADAFAWRVLDLTEDVGDAVKARAGAASGAFARVPRDLSAADALAWRAFRHTSDLAEARRVYDLAKQGHRPVTQGDALALIERRLPGATTQQISRVLTAARLPGGGYR